MHIEIEQETTLATLDDFLRDVWLECCGHMSSFTIDDVEYVTPFTEEESMLGFGVERRDMDVSLGGLLEGGMEFTHEYDFGTTTERRSAWPISAMVTRETKALRIMAIERFGCSPGTSTRDRV